MKKRTYLDTAAGILGNPSSPHAEGRRARDLLEEARTKIARLTETKSDDVIFTSGATEANAIALIGATRAKKAAQGSAHVLYLPSAHASIVENAKLLEAEGVRVEPLPLRNSKVDTNALRSMIQADTVLVTMEAVCGETGVIWNTREVRHALDDARGVDGHRILLHVDATHAPLTEKITRAHFEADLLVFDGSKIGAMHGIGCLIAPRTIPLTPLYRGGGQERGIRSGTQNVEAAVAFAAALEEAVRNRDMFRERATRLRAHLLSLIGDIRNLQVNEGRETVPHILNVSLRERDTDYLVTLLDAAGSAISTKSACETNSGEGSRAVFALTDDFKRAESTLRISWGRRTALSDLTRFAKQLHVEVAFIDSGSHR